MGKFGSDVPVGQVAAVIEAKLRDVKDLDGLRAYRDTLVKFGTARRMRGVPGRDADRQAVVDEYDDRWGRYYFLGEKGRAMAQAAVFHMYPGHDALAVCKAVAEFCDSIDRSKVEYPKAYAEACRERLTPLVQKYAEEDRQRRVAERRRAAEAAEARRQAQEAPCTRCGGAAGEPEAG